MAWFAMSLIAQWLHMSYINLVYGLVRHESHSSVVTASDQFAEGRRFDSCQDSDFFFVPFFSCPTSFLADHKLLCLKGQILLTIDLN